MAAFAQCECLVPLPRDNGECAKCGGLIPTKVRLVRTRDGREEPCGWWPAEKRADLERFVAERRGQHQPYRIETEPDPRPQEGPPNEHPR